MKNKKILALLCLPVLVTLMILPLCSFTTTLNDQRYHVLTSYANAGVPYTYVSGSSTYYGVLNNCARVLLPNSSGGDTIAQKNNAIKTTACDYYVTSDTRLRIDSNSKKLYLDDDDNTRLSLTYFSSNPSKAYLPFKIHAENVNMIDDLTYSFFYSGYLIDLSQYDVDVDFNFISYVYYFEDDELQYDDWTWGENSYNINHLGFSSFNVYDFLYSLMESEFIPNFEHDILFFTFPVCDITIRIYSNGGDTEVFPYAESVVVDSRVSQPGERDSGILGSLVDSFEIVLNKVYIDGVNVGLSTAPDVWGSISDFLETTIGGFLEFEFIEGISFGGLLSVFLGFILVFIFLKVFAGG